MDKAPDAFRTISEVADDLDVPQHVLRFWETRFTQIRPMKRSGGRRYYRPDDVALLRGIRHLLYGEGYTIRGVQRILREQGVAVVQNAASGGPLPSSRKPDITEAAEEQLLEASEEEEEEELEEDAEEADEADEGGEDEEEDEEEEDDEEDEEDEEEDDEEEAKAPPARAPVVSVTPANALSRDDIRKLEAALHELSECRRLLDEVLNA